MLCFVKYSKHLCITDVFYRVRVYRCWTMKLVFVSYVIRFWYQCVDLVELDFYR